MLPLQKKQDHSFLIEAMKGKELVHPDLDLMRGKDIAKVGELNAVLEQLPPQRLQAIRLAYLEEKKYADAASQMEITKNRVKTHLKIGRPLSEIC